jgi:putative aldouronate transport system substrate-binding protein
MTILCSVLLFNGCSKKQNSVELPNEKPITTFSVLFTDPNAKVNWGLDPISREITKQTGIALDIEVLSTDLNSRINTMIASNTYPDIILSLDNYSLAELIEAKALVPLDDYIEPYGNNIKSVFGDDLDKMRNGIDNKIYGFNREYKDIPSNSDSTFFVQYNLLIENNYPEINTLDELFELMLAYKEAHPTVNGEPLIGLSGYSDSYGLNITFANPAMRASGYQNDGMYAVLDDYSVKYGLTLPSSKDYFKWLNKLYLNDLFDKDAVIQTRSEFVEKVSSGRVLVATTEKWDLSDSEAALINKDMESYTYAQLPLTLTENTPIHYSNYDPYGNWKSVITTSCKNPELAFQFFDAMWGEDMQILTNWGIEGNHYDLINGKRVLSKNIVDMSRSNPDWKSITGLQLYTMWSYGANVLGSDGQYINPFNSSNQLTDAQGPIEKQTLDAYHINSWLDLCPPQAPSKYGFIWKQVLPSDTPGAYAEHIVNNEIRRNFLPKIILAENDEAFETTWQAFVDEVYKSGMAEREKEISEALISYMNPK